MTDGLHDKQSNGQYDARSPGLDYLLAEIETARAFVQYDVGSSDKRIDLLLTIASGLAAGTVILSQTHIDSQDFLFLMLVASASLLVIGLPVLLEVIRSDANAVAHIRALNVIREYFATHYPEIVDGISMPRNPNFPTFSTFAPARRLIPIAINSMAGAVTVVAGYMIYTGRMALDPLSIVISIVVFVVLVIFQEVLTVLRFRAIQKDIARQSGK